MLAQFKIYSLIALLAFVFLSACNDLIRPDQLQAPKDILQDSFPQAPKTECLSDPNCQDIIKDYAKISIGDSAPDGTKVIKATDAAEIHTLLAQANKKIFIRLPESINKQEHVFKSILAASLRMQNDPTVKGEIKFIKLKSLNFARKRFAFNPSQIKVYYLSMAKKINGFFKAGQTAVLDLDELPDEINKKDFLAELSTPNLVVLSKQNFSALKLFDDDSKSNQFFPQGLTANQTYVLMQKEFANSVNQNIKDDAENLALENSKIMQAMKPKSSLGLVASFFKKISSLLKNPTASGNVTRELTNLLSTSPDFTGSLGFENYSLQQLQEKVDANKDAFRGAFASLAQAQSTLDDIRNKDLPAIKNETDKIKTLSDQSLLIKTQTDKIQSIKDDTTALTSTQVPQVISDISGIKNDIKTAQTAINSHTTKAINGIDMAALGSNIKDAITQSSNALQSALSALGTFDSGSITDAINNLKTKVGSGASTSTVELKSLQDAINEIKNKTDTLPNDIATKLDALASELSKATTGSGAPVSAAELTSLQTAINQHTTDEINKLGIADIKTAAEAAKTAAEGISTNLAKFDFEALQKAINDIVTKATGISSLDTTELTKLISDTTNNLKKIPDTDALNKAITEAMTNIKGIKIDPTDINNAIKTAADNFAKLAVPDTTELTKAITEAMTNIKGIKIDPT
ncbi:MAG: hypothetical protein KC505_10960, partial [Myxococcales bacterium]|nr:hypothetical protein [Myxococcales bacterium]